jgi:hypothetical protein
MPLMELTKIISLRFSRSLATALPKLTSLHSESRATRHKLLGMTILSTRRLQMERRTMRVYRLAISMCLGLCLGALAESAPEATAVAEETGIPPTRPATARVWFLRPSGSMNGNVVAAEPEVFANGEPIGDIPAGTDFYRDFPPETYSFTVQPYGLPTGQADTVRLAAGRRPTSRSSGYPAWTRAIPRAVGASDPIPSVC